MAEPWDLGRFVVAQDPIIDRALVELRAGRKRSHWMWFVFPQLRDLGRSVTAAATASRPRTRRVPTAPTQSSGRD